MIVAHLIGIALKNFHLDMSTKCPLLCMRAAERKSPAKLYDQTYYLGTHDVTLSCLFLNKTLAV